MMTTPNITEFIGRKCAVNHYHYPHWQPVTVSLARCQLTCQSSPESPPTVADLTVIKKRKNSEH